MPSIVQPITRPVTWPVAERLDALALRKGVGYQFANAEASALVARFTAPPTNARKALIDTLVGSLKTAGVWSKLDLLYVMAAHDAQAARRNWLADAYNLTPVSAPTFAVDRGYQGDGSASYLETGFNPTSAAGQYTLNAAHLGVWSRSDLTVSNAYDMGILTAGLNARHATGTSMRGIINTATYNSYNATPNSLGHFVHNRSTSAAQQGYRNGASIGSNTQAVTSMPDGTLRVCAGPLGAFSARQLPVAHAGASLTSQNVSDLYAALTTYLQAVGAA